MTQSLRSILLLRICLSVLFSDLFSCVEGAGVKFRYERYTYMTLLLYGFIIQTFLKFCVIDFLCRLNLCI